MCPQGGAANQLFRQEARQILGGNKGYHGERLPPLCLAQFGSRETSPVAPLVLKYRMEPTERPGRQTVWRLNSTLFFVVFFWLSVRAPTPQQGWTTSSQLALTLAATPWVCYRQVLRWVVHSWREMPAPQGSWRRESIGRNNDLKIKFITLYLNSIHAFIYSFIYY